MPSTATDMPAITAHYSFALELLEKHPLPFKEAVFLGAQGPDPFFFYGQLPWKKRIHSHEIAAFGSLLHHIDITEVYASLLEYATHQKEKEPLLSYIHGLFLHYVLDRDCHPYIFPKAGFSSLPEEKKFYSVSHCELETYLDYLLGKEKGTFTYNASRYLKIGKKELLAISKMWFEVNKRTLQEPTLGEKSFYWAVHDYASTLRFTNVPHFFKKVFIPLLMGKCSLPYAMLLPDKIPTELASIDFLNKKKAPWPNVVNGEFRYESFSELWEEASEDYEEILPFFGEAAEGMDIRPGLANFVKGIDHDGIRPGDKMIYSDVLWPQGFIPKK